MLPVMAIAFAVAGAFASNAMERDQSTQKTGYIDAPRPCSVQVKCATSGNILCTNQAGQQAYGKINPNDTTCPQELFRLVQ